MTAAFRHRSFGRRLGWAWLACMIGLVPAVSRADESAATAPKITYEDHVKPILREHCFVCHNQSQAKSDLALDNFASLARGGASGSVLTPGEPANSRLWLLVNHEDSPAMPPERDKLPANLLDTIRQWIEQGALENSGSVAKVKRKPQLAASTATGSARPAGPAAMPQGLSRRAATTAPRGSAVTALAASPWAPLVAVASWRQVLLYHSPHGGLLGVLPFPEGVPQVLKFSRSGELLLVGGGHAGKSGRVVVFDVRSGERVFELGDEIDSVLAADINEDHTRVALGGPGRMLRVYSLEDGSLMHEIKKHTDWILAVEFSPDGVLLASADRAGNMYVWEPEGAREYLSLKGHTAAITDLSWRDDSNVLASVGEDAQVRLWEMEGGTQIKNWATGGSGVEAVEFDHQGRLLTAGRDQLVQIWDQNGQSLKCFLKFGDIALDAAMTHDGLRVVAGDWTGQIQLLDVESTQQVGLLTMSPPSLAEVAAADQARAAALQARVDASLAELTAGEQQVAALAPQVQQAVAAAGETAAQAQAATQRAAEAAAALQQLASQLATMQQQLAATKAALAQVQAEVAEAQASAAAAQAESQAAQAAPAAASDAAQASTGN